MSRDPGTDRPPLSEVQEDYLKAILTLGSGADRRVGTGRLSELLGVSAASVTGMVQRLAQLGLVTHRPYRGVRLTDEGRRVALEMVRHHRLLECFLVHSLGYGWDEVHAEAERLEHVISEEMEARIARLLGDPTHDPHGDPIPRADLSMPPVGCLRSLPEIHAGGRGRLARVGCQDADSLTLLSRLGLRLGAEVEVVEQTTAGVRVRLGDTRYLLPADLAETLFIDESDHTRGDT